jgi:hypothetical protein
MSNIQGVVLGLLIFSIIILAIVFTSVSKGEFTPLGIAGYGLWAVMIFMFFIGGLAATYRIMVPSTPYVPKQTSAEAPRPIFTMRLEKRKARKARKA